jgi:hypothetical protein
VAASSADASPVRDLGYYFTDWIWERSSIDFMKSMLLFFDGLTLALPSDLAARMVDRDPILATPLAERGLLINFDPTITLDSASAERLAAALYEFLEQNPMTPIRGGGMPITGSHWGDDALMRTSSHWGHDRVGQLSRSHWGASSARERTVSMLERAFIERGLAIRDPHGGGLFRMNLWVRMLVLTLFAQALRTTLGQRGINLHLATDSDDVVDGMASVLGFDSRVDAMNPLQLNNDLSDVGVDLSAVPLDEVLSFREENGQHYRAYAKGLRDLLASLAQAAPIERQQILQERKNDIRDQASDLRHLSRRAFGTQTATLLLSLAGAAWTLHTGDPIGAILAGASAGLAAAPAEDGSVTAYSYLLRTRNLGSGSLRFSS